MRNIEAKQGRPSPGYTGITSAALAAADFSHDFNAYSAASE
jgi:hypothetical protein